MTTISKITGIWNDLLRDRTPHLTSTELTDFFQTLITSIEGLKAQIKTWYPKDQNGQRHWPNIFISYAWPNPNPSHNDTIRLQIALKFLEVVLEYLMSGEDSVFLDISNMQGNFSEQQRIGIQNSNFVFLIGTTHLRNRIMQNPSSNVALEFREINDKINQNPTCEFLVPIMLDGDYSSAFPERGSGGKIAENMIFDCRGLLEERLELTALTNLIKNFLFSTPFGIIPRCFDVRGRKQRLYEAVVNSVRLAINHLTSAQITVNQPSIPQLTFSQSPNLLCPVPKPKSPSITLHQRVKHRSEGVKEQYNVTDEEVRKVIDAVVRGQLDELEKSLNTSRQKNKGYCALLHLQGDISKEDSTESFKQITVLQCAMGESDPDACDKILEFFRIQGEDNFAAEQINSIPILYYSLKPTIDAYESLKNNWSNWSPEEKTKHWCEVIGKHQRGWPAWLRYEIAEPGYNALWLKKTVCARPKKRSLTESGKAISWIKGCNHRCLGSQPPAGFGWIRSYRDYGQSCDDKIIQSPVPSYYPHLDAENLRNEQIAIVAYREKLQADFTALLRTNGESATSSPRA